MTLAYMKYHIGNVEAEIVKETEALYGWYVGGKFIGQISAWDIPRYTNGFEFDHVVYDAE